MKKLNTENSNRIIKFRAWDKINKEMYLVNKLEFDRDLITLELPKGNEPWEAMSIPKSQIILMQFTGLFDKNGKEIYEFDLVKHKDTGQVSVVEWSSGDWGWLMRSIKSWNPKAQFDSSTDEVIGNIYENKN